MKTKDLISNASLPAVPEGFQTPLEREAWKPQAALDRLRHLTVPGISIERLESIQFLRAYYANKLNSRN